MEDSTTMTIEFLRARLLSERSVSRTARQRADELAKRVAELEKQLKSVNLQRKKAEQATVEVLAILENNGIGDFLETFDSNSDQERVHCESKEDNNSAKEEQLSNSELEGSSLSGRSLSWKSCSDSPNSLGKKYIDQANRRQSSFGSTSDSSAKLRVGKSCRQIKRRETISAEDNVVDESIPVDDQENGVAIGLGDACNCHKDRLQILKEGSKNEVETVFLEDQRKETNDCDINECRRDAEMKRAIENNAQLMGRYEAEENAQREWEDKFRENSSCTADSCEHGNRSDITEEMEELRETAESTHTIPSLGQGVTSEVEECRNIAEPMTKTLPNDLPTTCLDMETQISFAKFSFLNQESSGSTTKVKQIQERSDSSSLWPSEHQSTKKFSSFNGDVNLYKGESSGTKNGLQMTLWHEPPNDLGGVLEALQRAKLSLKHELNRLPLSAQDWPVVRMTETSRLAIKPGDGMEIPIGCAGLFRVPTDSQFEATTLSNLSGPHTDSGSSLMRYYPNVGIAGSDQYTTGLINSTQKPYFDPYVNVGMGPTASSRYTYPSSYADLAPIMPSNDRVRRLACSSTGSEVPAGDQYSAYYDQTRSNVHHR